MEERQTKPCPFCKETIKAEAIKCRFCGEFIDEDPQENIRRQKENGALSADGRAENANDDSVDPGIIAELSLSPVVLVPQVLKLFYWLLASAFVGYGTYYATQQNWKLITLPNAKSVCWGLCAVLAVVGLLIFWLKYLMFKKHEYTITIDRIESRHGLFSRTISNIDMWRIQDIRLDQPFTQRIFGVGTVIVESTDPSDPHLEIGPISKASLLYKQLRDTAVEADRKRGVLHVDH